MAYELIPRSERCDKHRLAAAWIESLGRCEDHAELLADHYVRALELARLTSGAIGELVQPARRALAGAGERAASLGAYAAASRHYDAPRSSFALTTTRSAPSCSCATPRRSSSSTATTRSPAPSTVPAER